MPSDQRYLDFILEQLGDLEELAYRQMMGEYILYYRGKLPPISAIIGCW